MAVNPVAPQQQVIELLAGYWKAQVVRAFAELGLADRFARQPRSADELAAAAGASADGVARLLRAAAHCGLVEQQDDGRYRLTPAGATLRSGVTGSLRAYAGALAGPAHWRCWEHLDEAVRSGGPVAEPALGRALWAHFGDHAAEGAQFAGAMGELSALVALDLLALGGLDTLTSIVDVGASRGVLLSALLRAAPQARGLAYDRPEVVAAATPDPALAGRLDFVAGDFFAAVPAGARLYLLKQILHDYDDAAALRILRNLAAAAARGAALWVIEMLLPEQGDAGLAALVDLNMLVLLGGRERTTAQYAALLDRSGWTLHGADALRGGFHRLRASRKGNA
ncbi:MAG: methyltransferase [Solimonas sp.]